MSVGREKGGNGCGLWEEGVGCGRIANYGSFFWVGGLEKGRILGRKREENREKKGKNFEKGEG